MAFGEGAWRQGLCSPRRQGLGLGQEAGDRRRRTCVRLLEAEKCPLREVPAAIASACSGHFSWILQQASADVWTISWSYLHNEPFGEHQQELLYPLHVRRKLATRPSASMRRTRRRAVAGTITSVPWGPRLEALTQRTPGEKYVERRRVGQAPQRQQTSGCEVGVTGTLQRAPTANTSPDSGKPA